MRSRIPIALLLCSLSFLGLSQAQVGNDADVANVKAFNQAYESAEKTADVGKMVSLWSPDGIALPPGEPALVGSRQIRAWLDKNRMDTTTLKMTKNTANWRDIHVNGDYAFQWAQTFVNVRSKADDAGIHMSGTTLQVLKKQPDGSWRLYRSSWSYQPRQKDK
jgi:uncharacterized protein (TIGR02246 family)